MRPDSEGNNLLLTGQRHCDMWKCNYSANAEGLSGFALAVTSDIVGAGFPRTYLGGSSSEQFGEGSSQEPQILGFRLRPRHLGIQRRAGPRDCPKTSKAQSQPGGFMPKRTPIKPILYSRFATARQLLQRLEDHGIPISETRFSRIASGHLKPTAACPVVIAFTNGVEHGKPLVCRLLVRRQVGHETGPPSHDTRMLAPRTLRHKRIHDGGREH